jgi:flagellar biosynthetic protein FliP
VRHPLRDTWRHLVLLTAVVATLLLGVGTATAQQLDVDQDPDAPAQVDDDPATDDDPAGPDGPAVPDVPDVPDVSVSVTSDDGGLSRSVVIVLLLTVGSVAPGLLLLMTAFTRFVVVLGLTKQAIGMQTIPPAQVLVGLAMFLTFFVMSPVFSEVNDQAIQPLLAGEIDQGEAFERGFAPLRTFMLDQTRDDDLQLFVDLAGAEQPADPEEVGATTLVPAFVISELRTAFMIGFVIFVPFLVIDLVVSAVLMSLGMMMLPPVFISMPLKLLLFVLVDGWSLVVGSLVTSVNGVG